MLRLCLLRATSASSPPSVFATVGRRLASGVSGKLDAVKTGRQVALFPTWDETKEQVLRVPGGSIYKSFGSQSEAQGLKSIGDPSKTGPHATRYALLAGCPTASGLFRSWANMKVTGYKGALHKAFRSEAESHREAKPAPSISDPRVTAAPVQPSVAAAQPYKIAPADYDVNPQAWFRVECSDAVQDVGNTNSYHGVCYHVPYQLAEGSPAYSSTDLAGYGVVIREDSTGVVVAMCGGFVHDDSGDGAISAYSAMLLGLKAASDMGLGRIVLETDSEVIVNQLMGDIRMPSGRVLGLHGRVHQVLPQLQAFHVRQVTERDNRAGAYQLGYTALIVSGLLDPSLGALNVQRLMTRGEINEDGLLSVLPDNATNNFEWCLADAAHEWCLADAAQAHRHRKELTEGVETIVWLVGDEAVDIDE